MNEISIINKLKGLFPIWKSQKAGKEEAQLKNESQGNGSDLVIANAMAKRNAEGKIITPTEPAFRRNYY